MWYTIIVIFMLILIVLLVFSTVFLYRYAKDESVEIDRVNRRLGFLWDWMYRERLEPERMKEIFEKLDIKKVDIYGAGLIGVQLYFELIEFGIKVEHFVDNSKTSVGIDGIPVVKKVIDNSKPDAIIISVIGEPMAIKERLAGEYKRIFLIDELI